jgi:hypothetical protein
MRHFVRGAVIRMLAFQMVEPKVQVKFAKRIQRRALNDVGPQDCAHAA